MVALPKDQTEYKKTGLRDPISETSLLNEHTAGAS
jgi:hypothetical protein